MAVPAVADEVRPDRGNKPWASRFDASVVIAEMAVSADVMTGGLVRLDWVLAVLWKFAWHLFKLSNKENQIGIYRGTHAAAFHWAQTPPFRVGRGDGTYGGHVGTI